MIPLTRIRTENAIGKKYRGNAKKKMDIELMKLWREFLRDRSIKIKFKTNYWKDAKPQLIRESFGKCAYCEAQTNIVTHGDVEHFRPKSKYWWLAYTYDNYLYSCQICNQVHKSNNFDSSGDHPFPDVKITANTTDEEIDQLAGNISPDPLDINLNYTFKKYLEEHQLEKAYLINPYFDDPDKYFAYEADDVVEEVKIVPKKPEYKKYIEACELYLGINRLELKNNRYKIYVLFDTYIRSYAELPEGVTKSNVLKRLNEMKSNDFVFAGMSRYFGINI